MTNEFAGKTAIITGASRGIGRDVAVNLGAAGANVIVNYATSGEAGVRVADTITGAGGRAIVCQADVSKRADVDRLVSTTLEVFKRVDILVNNAGVNVDRPLLDITEDEWNAVIDVNLKGAFSVSRQPAERCMPLSPVTSSTYQRLPRWKRGEMRLTTVRRRRGSTCSPNAPPWSWHLMCA